MKLLLISLTGAALLVISGCAGANSQSRAGSGAPVGEQPTHQRVETIAYNWESNRVVVSFNRQARDSSWEMVVKDGWDVYEQSTKGEGRVWDLSGCRCSVEECLRIIDQSLADFHAEKPDAKLESVDLEMQVISNLWSEILAGLNQRLATLDGEKKPGIFEVPLEAGDAVQHVLDKSPTIAAVGRLLGKHGMKVQSVQASQTVMFKDVLTGRKWSDIATLPGLGILAPGTIEFNLGESRKAADARRVFPAESAAQK